MIDLALQYRRGSLECVDFVNLALQEAKFTAQIDITKPLIHLREYFKLIPNPEENCVVLMTPIQGRPHVGIIRDGLVLHLPNDSSPQCSELRYLNIWFNNIKFYRPIS